MKSMRPRQRYGSKRSELEVLLDILKAVKMEAQPTRIMCMTNTSWRPLHHAFGILTQAGLIEVRNSVRDSVDKRTKKRFYINAKGEQCLKSWENATVMIHKAIHELDSKSGDLGIIKIT